MSQSGQDSLFGPGEHSVSQERGCSGLHREKQTVWWLKAWVKSMCGFGQVMQPSCAYLRICKCGTNNDQGRCEDNKITQTGKIGHQKGGSPFG